MKHVILILALSSTQACGPAPISKATSSEAPATKAVEPIQLLRFASGDRVVLNTSSTQRLEKTTSGPPETSTTVSKTRLALSVNGVHEDGRLRDSTARVEELHATKELAGVGSHSFGDELQGVTFEIVDGKVVPDASRDRAIEAAIQIAAPILQQIGPPDLYVPQHVAKGASFPATRFEQLIVDVFRQGLISGSRGAVTPVLERTSGKLEVRILELDASRATLEIAGAPRYEVRGGEGGVPVKGSLAIDVEGTLLLDVKAKRLIEEHYETTLTTALQIPSQAGTLNIASEASSKSSSQYSYPKLMGIAIDRT